MEQLREYLSPEMDVILVSDDVITASGMGGGIEGSGDIGGDDFWNW